MALVIDSEIDIRIRVFIAQRPFDIRQREELLALVHIHLLQAHDIRILRQQVMEHLVLLGFLKLSHAPCVPRQDSDCGDQ